MQISKGIEIINTALYFKKEKTLVINDLHLGYEESLHHKGVLVPKRQLQDIIECLENILAEIKAKSKNKSEGKPQTIVINGDLKHEFGTVLKQEWRDVLFLIDFLLKKKIKIIIIKGNHDPITKFVVGKRNVKVIKEYQIDDTLIVHGDELVEIGEGKAEEKPTKTSPDHPPLKKSKKADKTNKANKTKIKRIIIGHEHPAITIREGSKYEKYKCFLKGKWNEIGIKEKLGSKELIVMPSFNPLLEGTDVLFGQLLSPFLKDIKNFEVFVVGEKEVLEFGKVKNHL